MEQCQQRWILGPVNDQFALRVLCQNYRNDLCHDIRRDPGTSFEPESANEGLAGNYHIEHEYERMDHAAWVNDHALEKLAVRGSHLCRDVFHNSGGSFRWL
jgi:hypothetical protein